jgi:hypothetical protein
MVDPHHVQLEFLLLEKWCGVHVLVVQQQM